MGWGGGARAISLATSVFVVKYIQTDVLQIRKEQKRTIRTKIQNALKIYFIFTHFFILYDIIELEAKWAAVQVATLQSD